MAETDALASFVAPWRQRQPEMGLLLAFCPPAERRRFDAWGALNQQLADTLFTTSDAGVARTKLAWFERDLTAGPRQAQHPVSRALLAEAAMLPPAEAWRALVSAAIDLGDAARDTGNLLPAAETAAYAGRLADLESQLLAAPSDPAAVALSLRLDRWLFDREAAASAGVAVPALHGALPPRLPLGLYRGGRLAFDRWRLERLAAGALPDAVRTIPALRGLWLAWSAARRSRR